jgi:hypothetical protein
MPSYSLSTSSGVKTGEESFLIFFYGGSPFYSSEIRATQKQWRYSTCLPYTTGGMHSQNKHDRHTDIDSDYSKTIHEEMQEEDKTKEVRDERVEKHSCQIELRGAHLKLVYYNGKQVLLWIQHATCHCSPACEERRRTS